MADGPGRGRRDRGHTIEGSPEPGSRPDRRWGWRPSFRASRSSWTWPTHASTPCGDDANSMLEGVLDLGRGGTFQSRTERDVIVRTSLARLEQLDIGDQALTFGRIDRVTRATADEVGHRRGGQRRRAGRSRRSTSGAWPSTAPTTTHWWSTGAPRSPNPSTGPPAATPRAWCCGATWPWKDGGWSVWRTSASAPPDRRSPRRRTARRVGEGLADGDGARGS